MNKRMNNQYGSFLLLLFTFLFLWGGIGIAADPQLEALYVERAETIAKVDFLREKIQRNTDQLRLQNREYLLLQGSINFAEDEKNLFDLRQQLQKVEEEILGLLNRDQLPLPAWRSQTKRETIYTGAPPFSFYHPLAAPFSSQETLPRGGILFLFILWGAGAAVLLYGIIRKIFPLESGMLYPCLLTEREDHDFEPLYIPFSSTAERG